MHKAILFLKKIPKGKVVSYRELAEVCGTSPRHIGRIMSQNTDTRNYPCYRVVSSSGELLGYNRGQEQKKRLLQNDGIEVTGGRVNKKYFFFFSNDSV